MPRIFSHSSLKFILPLATLLQGCATSTISFQSQPVGAEVLAHKLGSAEKPVIVGTTPLLLKTTDFEKQFAGPGPFEVEFRKDGYRPFTILVTQMINADLTLTAELPSSNGLDDLDQFNALIDHVFEIQRLARAGKYEEALQKIKGIQKDAPQLSVTYEIEGGIYYLQKKYRQAFDAFTVAAKYNPRNIQAIRMRQKLRGPAATEPAAKPEQKKEGKP